MARPRLSRRSATRQRPTISRNPALDPGGQRRAYRLAGSGAIPIFLGGDHTLSMGSVNGVARYWPELGRPAVRAVARRPCRLQHPETTMTGNMHGVSAAFLCGEPGSTVCLATEPRASVARQVDLFGIRRSIRWSGSWCRAPHRDRRHARHRRARRRRADPPSSSGCGRGTACCTSRSTSISSIPRIAPGVGTTVPGGATFREAHLVMEMLHDSGWSLSRRRRAQSVPRRARPHRALAVDLVGSLFGRQITDRRTPSNAVLPGNGQS